MRMGIGRIRLLAALVVVVSVAAVAIVVDNSEDSGGGSGPAPATPPYEKGATLTEPPVVESDGPVLETTLTAKNGTVTVSGVAVENAMTYAAGTTKRGFLGPTLHVRPGQTIDLTLDNQLVKPLDVPREEDGDKQTPVQVCPPAGESVSHAMMHGPMPSGGGQITNLHYHGLHVTPTTRVFHGEKVFGDNVLLNLPPGKSHFRFHVPADHDQGTFWYHAHRHGCTDDQVFRGLAGLLLIGDVRSDLPPRFRDVRTRSIMLKDIQAVPYKGGWAIPNDHDWALKYHTQYTVNGLVQPKIDIKPGETQLWRLANVSSTVWYEPTIADAKGHQDSFTIVAEDGNPATMPRQAQSVLLAPGHRVDVLVRGQEGPQRYLETLPFDQGRLTFPQYRLASVDVTGGSGSALAPPEPRSQVGQQFPTKRGPNRSFTFSFTPRPGTHPAPSEFAFINGLPFDPERVDADPRLGTTERWTLINRSTEWHPFHIHQDDFRVISVNGTRVHFPSDQDVVPLPPMTADGVPGRVVIDMPFTQFKGTFVFHCHILDHEDGGMMALVEVK